MARFDIISKDGKTIRYSGKPRYCGSYLKPSFLEFSEMAYPTPIAWEVGDYVDYPRTGMRYRLYSIPQPSKNARKGSYGGAFTYSNVQFHAATKELEIALFRDLVANDNNIHFSTSPDVATYENVEGIARRIQACMDYFYPGRWEIRMAEFDAVADADVIEKITTAKDFAMSGGTCLDALSKIYELWEEIGWVHTHENGKEVITIGYANKRIGANTTDAYLYGKGNGLTAIKKSQTNKDEFATRLYVYGSERNLPHRYYNGKDILNAESVDIRNLMLPLDKWGTTDGLPDARKAYLENAEAVAKYGVIPKTHYFDSDDAGADIYPSIEGMTVGQLRKVLVDMGETKYSPNASIYPNDSERVDEVWGSPRMVDDGVLKRNGKEHDIENGWYLFATTTPGTTIPKGTAEKTAVVENHLIKDLDIDAQGIVRAKITFTSDKICTLADAGYESVSGVLTLANSLDSPSIKEEMGFTFVLNDDGVWEGRLPKVIANYDKLSYMKYVAFATMSVYVTPKKALASDVTASVNISDGYVTFIADQLFDKTFQLTLKQIGFDINERAAMGEGKVISMKTGMCAGRNFVISECRYVANTDKWVLTCRRQQDDTLGMLFPNKDYQIAEGDQLVLLDIALPEVCIGVAQERLLAEGEKLLAKASRIQNHYEPMIDAKVMIESGRTLREGMFMEISDEDVIDNGTDYILIDTLSIYEDESAIPTYKVTLREKRKVTYKGTPSATSETSTKSYGEDQTVNADIDLSDYATKGYVDNAIGNITPGGGGSSVDIEGSAFISVSQDGVISLDVDPQGGLGRTEQGLGIVDIPSAASRELTDYADTAAQTAYEQAYDDAVRAATSYAETMPFKTINGQSVRGEGDLTIVGTKGEKGEKGDKGDAGVTSAEVSVDNKAGLPSATASVVDQVLKIKFSGLKGEQGNSGFTGAADELEVVNNLTQGGAAAALSAEMGKQLNEVLYGKTESNEGEDEGGSEGADGEIVTLTSADFVQGGINGSGAFIESATRIRTDKIAVEIGDYWQITADSSQRWAYELYNSDGTATYNSGWIGSNQVIVIETNGFIGFVICKTNNGNIVPSELLTSITFMKSKNNWSRHITEDDLTSQNYNAVSNSVGEIRGRFLVDAAEFIDYKISLSVATNSNMKVAIHLKNSLDWGWDIYDSGWILAGQTKSVIKANAPDARYIALAFLYTSSNSNQPSIEDIKKYITFDIAYDAGDNESGGDTEPSEPVVDRGLVGKVDDLSASVSEVEKNLKSMEEEIDELQQQVAEGVEIVNNLTDGGIDKALSAEMGKRIGEVLYGGSEYIDLSTLPEQDCSLGSGGWFKQGSAGRHKAVDVKDAESVSIEAKGLQTYVAFVTDAYNPPVAGNASVPFATGYSQRTTIAANTTYEAEVPSDAAWLILTTVDGAGNVIEYGDVKVVIDSSKAGLIDVAHDVAGIKDKTEDLYNDIHGIPSDFQDTQNDLANLDYLTAQGRRGYVQWVISQYPSWELSVNVPSSSLIKCAIQGSASASYGGQLDDSGWINPGKSKTYSSTTASGSVKYARLVFTDYATAETIPSVEDILANGITFSFKAVVQEGGLVVRMDELESKVGMPVGSIAYQGEKVDLSEHGFTYKIIGSLATGVSSRQGSALWGKYFFQFHNTLENIVVYDLEAKKNVQTLTLTPNNNHHAGSGGFGNEFYDADDDFPLLYISSMYEMKVYVYRITGEVGAWSITLVQTITIGLDVLKIPNITIDRESNKIVFFGYTKASWNDATGNQSVITSCDIPLLSEGDVTISEFYNVSRLPFIYAQQGAFARFGKLYLSYGNTVSDCGIFVIDYKGGVTLTSIDFTSMGNFEPEGFEKYGDKVIMTDQNGNIYELSF